jgi:hypothetical protein
VRVTALAGTDLLAWLAGRWTIERAINGRPGAFTGTARFVPEEPDGIRWEEEGRLELDAYRGPATRTLHLVGRDAPSAVRFDDGRPFHALDLRGGRWHAEHLCGEDVYRGEYVVESDDTLRVTWHVDGPGRADVIESVYRRAAG